MKNKIYAISALALAIASSSAYAAQIEEVVVTATKRAGVDIQDVPASISVYGAEALKNAKVESLTDLTTLSPSLIAVQTQSPSATRIGLRGISTPANNVGFEASVGISIDGVARSRTGLALSEMPQLASVEVLRGPQGTLFGRNTSAGVININTAKPDAEGGGFVNMSVGNYDARIVQGAINLPINEQWNGRIDAKHRERDGFVTDVNSGADINSIDRSMVRAQLTREDDDSSLRLIADWVTSDSVCCAGIVTDRSPLSAVLIGVAAAAGNLGYGSADPSDYEVALSSLPTEEVSDWGFSAEYNSDIDGMNFTSVTAYRDWESDVLRDGDMAGVDLAEATSLTSNTSFSQELRLQGESGSVNWLVGAYYLHDEVDFTDEFNTGSQLEGYMDRLLAALSASSAPIAFQGFGTLPTPAQAGANGIPSIKALAGAANAMDYLDPMADTATSMELTTDAIALFTHNEISLSEDLTATIGLRYTSEDKELSYANTSTGSAEACGFANALTGINPQLAAFGGLICLPVANPLFNGAGNDDRSDENVSGTAKLAYAMNDDVLFYASFSRGFKSGGYNLSSAGFSVAGGPSATDLEFNAEEVDAYELGWNSTLGEAVTFNGAIFSQDVSGYQQLDFVGTHFVVGQGDFEVEGLELDLAGRPMENLMLQASYAYTDAKNSETGVQPNAQSKNTFSTSATLFLPLSDALMGSVHLNGRYASKQRTGGTNVQDAFTLYNARISIVPNAGAWELSLFGQNLTGEDAVIASFDAPVQPGSTAVFPIRPRMYGAELRYQF